MRMVRRLVRHFVPGPRINDGMKPEGGNKLRAQKKNVLDVLAPTYLLTTSLTIGSSLWQLGNKIKTFKINEFIFVFNSCSFFQISTSIEEVH